MDEFQLTDFPKLYSTNKKDVERFTEQVYSYAKYYGYITIRDFVRLWFNLREDQSNTYIQSASVQWCVEYKDLPKRHLYYKYVSDEHGINPEGSTFISDIIIGIAELRERGELK